MLYPTVHHFPFPDIYVLFQGRTLSLQSITTNVMQKKQNQKQKKLPLCKCTALKNKIFLQRLSSVLVGRYVKLCPVVVGFQILGKAPQFLVTRTLLSLLCILRFVFQTCLNVYISLEVGQRARPKLWGAPVVFSCYEVSAIINKAKT